MGPDRSECPLAGTAAVSAGEVEIDPGASEAAALDAAGPGAAARPGGGLVGRTFWARGLEAPARDFLRTETGSAAVLLGGAVAALVWANIGNSYEHVRTTVASVTISGGSVRPRHRTVPGGAEDA